MNEPTEMTYQERINEINAVRSALLQKEEVSDERITRAIRLFVANRIEIGANKPKSREQKTPPSLDQIFTDL